MLRQPLSRQDVQVGYGEGSEAQEAQDDVLTGEVSCRTDVADFTNRVQELLGNIQSLPRVGEGWIYTGG